MNALILCAGRGTRLGSLTEETAKPALPVGDRPLICRTLAWLREQGIQDVAINLHHRPMSLIRAVEQDPSGYHPLWQWELELQGSAGALRNLPAFFWEEPLLVVCGDNLIEGDLAPLVEFHESTFAGLLTIGCHREERPWNEVGVAFVDTDGLVYEFLEKPDRMPAGRWIPALQSAGLYILDPLARSYLDDADPRDIARDLIPALLDDGDFVYAKQWDGSVLDIGTLASFRRAQRQFPTTQREFPGLLGLLAPQGQDCVGAA